MNERGQYGRMGARYRYSVGASALSADDLQTDLSALNEEILVLQSKIMDQRTSLALADKLTKQVPFDVFYTKKWRPFLNHWQQFFKGTKRFLTATRGTQALTVSLPVFAAQLQDFRSHWLDMRVDARILLDALEQPSRAPVVLQPPGLSSQAPPSIPPSSMVSPQEPPSGQQLPYGRAEDAKDGAEKSNFILYAALGLGVVTAAAFAFSARGGAR